MYNPGSGNFLTLNYPGASVTTLFNINNNGVAVGQAFTQGVGTVFFTVDSSGTFHSIPVTSGYSVVSVYGISDSGDISAVVTEPTGTFDAVVHSDGSVTNYTANAGQFSALSLNNSLTLLEKTGTGPQLVDSAGNITVLQDPNFPAKFDYTFGGTGLNNAGTALGTVNNQYFPQRSFTLNSSSGLYAEPFCPNTASINAAIHQWAAINDNGVLLTQGILATPLPGLAQITLSPSSVTFPPTVTGQQSSPQTVTVANSGNTRLDIGSVSIVPDSVNNQAIVNVSGCSGGVISLDPGASCTLTLTAQPTSSASQPATLYLEDSAPGSPHGVPLSITGASAPPPTCTVSGTNPGPPAQVTFTAQDSATGIASVNVVQTTNATANVPSFAYGTKSPVLLTATQTNTSQPSSVEFQVTNTQRSSATCSSNFGGGSGGGPATWTSLGGFIAGRPSVSTNSDGRLEVVAQGSDSSIDDVAQSAPGGSWNGVTSLGGYIVGNAVLAANQNGDLEVFAKGGDSALWTTAQSSPGAWSGAFASLGGALISDSAVGINSNGTLDVFVLGTDNGLWHNTQTSPGGSWSGWSGLGGSFTGLPAVVANQDGRLQVFARGTDNSLWTLAQITPGGSWSAPVSLGGFLKANPAAALNTNGIVQAFVIGGDTSLWTIAQASAGSSSFGSFTNLGGSADADPSIAVNQDGRLEAFVLGGDNALWHNSQTSAGSSTWSGWTTLQGSFVGAPSAIRASNGDIAVFVRDSDNTFGFISQTSPGAWN